MEKTEKKDYKEKKPRLSAKFYETLYQVICTGVCFIVAALCIYPLLYSLVVSFAKPEDILYQYVIPIPTKVSLYAYIQVFTVSSFIGKAIAVSVFRTVVGTFLSVFISSMLAYAIARKNIPGKKYLMYLMIFLILFNGGLIPTYLVIKSVGLLDNIWVYVLPNIINAWNVIIIKQSMEGIPSEVEESAMLDGVNDLQNFTQIVLPMSKPVIAAISIFTLVFQWNSWYDAMLYVSPASSQLWPLQYYATISLNNLNQVNNADLGNLEEIMGIKDVDNMSIKMALTVVTTLPILCVYPFFQKYFTKGVYLGSVKG